MIESIAASLTQKGFDKTFGNYMLHGIEEVFIPETISWWPQTLGWKILAIIVVGAFCYFVYTRCLLWHENRYRRNALKVIADIASKSLDSPEILKKLPIILKSTALEAYPRSDIAQLSGARWISDLNSRCKRLAFTDRVGDLLTMLAYQPQHRWQIDREQIARLIDSSRYWVSAHQKQPKAESNV